MFSFLLGRSSTFFVAVCIFLGLIIASFIHSFTSHVPITNSALNLMTEETLNMVVNFLSLVAVFPGALPLLPHLMMVVRVCCPALILTTLGHHPGAMLKPLFPSLVFSLPCFDGTHPPVAS